MRRAREAMERLAAACAKTNVRAIYQLHHDQLIASPSAAFALVEGLPSKHIGVELDPGNESFDGFENHERSAHLLGEYLAAVAIKDTAIHQDRSRLNTPDKGWKRTWVPIDEGVVRWDDVAAAMRSVNFDGTIVMMPHYEVADAKEQRATLKREVEYLRRIINQASSRPSQWP